MNTKSISSTLKLSEWRPSPVAAEWKPTDSTASMGTESDDPVTVPERKRGAKKAHSVKIDQYADHIYSAAAAPVPPPPRLVNTLFGEQVDTSTTKFVAPCKTCGQCHSQQEEHGFGYVKDDEELKCFMDPISYAPLYDVRSVPCCRNSFSKFTIEKAVKKDHKCPMCRHTLSPKDIIEVPLMMCEMLDSLTVYCPWGCEQHMTRSLLPAHLTKCPRGMVSCGNGAEPDRCPLLLCREDADRHREQCEYRQVVCTQGCHAMLSQKEANAHNCLQHMGNKMSGLETTIATLMQQLEVVQYTANKNVALSSAKGAKARFINGVYQVTMETENGCPVYRKRNENERMLVYSSVNHWWVVLHQSSLAQVNVKDYGGNAHIAVPEGKQVRPDQCRGAWQVNIAPSHGHVYEEQSVKNYAAE